MVRKKTKPLILQRINVPPHQRPTDSMTIRELMQATELTYSQVKNRLADMRVRGILKQSDVMEHGKRISVYWIEKESRP